MRTLDHVLLTPERLFTRRACLLGPAAAGLLGATGVRAAGAVDAIARMRPGVCAVGTYNPLESPRFAFRGSGFFVGDGTRVATCWHVLPEAGALVEQPGKGRLAVLVADGSGQVEVREAEPVASERTHDLAVLSVRGRPGTPLPLGPAELASDGQEVVLIGYPLGGTLGFRPVSHRGMVAAVVQSNLPTAAAGQLKEGDVKRLREGAFELYQLDATAYPGNSGGPLIDVASQAVIGIVNMVSIKANRESAISQPTGITYAVPVRHLRTLLQPR